MATKKTPPSIIAPEFRPGRSGTAEGRKGWTFLTNHSHVLILVHAHPSLVLREIAARVGITERAIQQILIDLEEAGFVKRQRVGRQNHYEVLAGETLRHPIESHCSAGELLSLIVDHPAAAENETLS